jgi:iron complex outermembrane receptor protein
MAYVSWSKGYKTGGWTTRLTNPQLLAQPFSEEKATTWEAGFKSKLLNRRLQLNGSVFQTQYDGIQLNFQQGTSPTIRNAGDAEIKGVEVEAVAVPFEGFTVNASVGYLHARYTEVLAGVLAVSGPNVFQAGTFVGAPSAQDARLEDQHQPALRVHARQRRHGHGLGDWTYTSGIWNNAQRTYALKRPAVQVVNASVAYADPGGAWTLSVGGTNLTDRRYLTTGNENIAAGAIFGTYSRPREAYVRFGVTF